MSSQNFYVIYRAFLLGCQNFIRNSWLSAAATAVMVLAISFVLASVVLNTTFKDITSQLSQNLKVSVYLHNDVNRDAIDGLWDVFLDNEAVASVDYVDSQTARDRFTASYGDDLQIGQAVALVGDDIFPPALEVSVYDLNDINAVGDIAENGNYSDIVESVSLGKTDAQRTIERATAIQDTIVAVSVALVLIFGIVAFLIIFNTIRMAIFSRREEIQIMRLVGAPGRFIREPFLVEANLYGVAGGLLAFGLIYGTIGFFSEQITGSPELADSYAYFTQNKGVIALMLVGAITSGIVFSAFSCLLALQTHLKL